MLDPQLVNVGRITAVYWSGHERLAIALAGEADRARQLPGGLLDTSSVPIRLIIAPSRTVFDSVTGGRAPHWGGGVALPEARIIVLQVGRGGVAGTELRRVLHHELAHVVLRERVRVRLPRWFEEGYAATAAGEWHHGQVLQMNVNVARGRVWRLAEVDLGLRGGRAEAGLAYGLAASAVHLLDRWGGPRGLDGLLGALVDGRDFGAALRRAYGVTPGQFEVLWQRDLRRRYGWLALAAATGFMWSVLGILAVGLMVWRRRRDRERRARMDVAEDGSEVLDDHPVQA
jgi:hypothetical protein